MNSAAFVGNIPRSTKAAKLFRHGKAGLQGIFVEAMAEIGEVSPDRRIITSSPWALMQLGLTTDRWDVRLEHSTESIQKSAPGTFILYTGYRPGPFDPVPATLFYSDEDRQMAQEREAQGLNYVHLLKKTRPQFEEVVDASILTRPFGEVDTEKWPYYAKLFVRTEVPFE